MSELRAEQQRIIWRFDRQTLIVEPREKTACACAPVASRR